MNAILFDTLRLSRTLRDKGHFTPEQADALAEALGEAQHGDLATKADVAAIDTKIDRLEAGVDAKINKLEASVDAKIVRLEASVDAKIDKLDTKIDKLEAAVDAKIDKLEAAFDARIDKLEAAFDARMGMVETKIGHLVTKAELADVRADILKWIVGTIGFQTVVMVGALVTLVRIFAK